MRSDPPDWANRYTGIPFIDLGRDFEGADCYGLGRLVMIEEAGIHLPMFHEYDLASDSARTSEMIMREIGATASIWQKVAADQTRPLDWLLYRRDGVPSHLALSLDKWWILHTFRGSVAGPERIDSLALRHKETLVGVFRHKELIEHEAA